MSVLFSYAFRPLFLLATLYAIGIVPFWVAAWLGAHSVPTLLGAPAWWHAHEMIFGFAGAAVGGFALTAVATWTKRPPVEGAPLAALVALWSAARVLFLLPFKEVLVPAVVADVGYGALLFALMSREVIGARSHRNYKVLVILALFPLANALFFVGVRAHAPWTVAALLAGMWLLVLLINLIGGRIIPGFTRNWLKRRAPAKQDGPTALPPAFDRLDLAATVLLVGFAVAHVAGFPARLTAGLGAVAAALMIVRLARWKGQRTFVDCVEDVEASRWEHAKLSGHDYRAVADDGSWTLVLRRGEMVLHDASRGERLAVVTAGPVTDLDTDVTEYRGHGDGHTLVLRIGRSACALPDGVPLSGTTLTVVVDGERRAGCGAPLH